MGPLAWGFVHGAAVLAVPGVIYRIDDKTYVVTVDIGHRRDIHRTC